MIWAFTPVTLPVPAVNRSRVSLRRRAPFNLLNLPIDTTIFFRQTPPMSTPEPLVTPAPPDFLAIAKAIRFAFGIIVLILCFLNLKATLSIGRFDQLFMDMLGRRPLPTLTVFVLKNRGFLSLLSLALPLITLVTLASSLSLIHI